MLTFNKAILLDNINKLLQEQHISQETLKQVVNLDQPSISKNLTGNTKVIPFEFVYNIAQFLNVSIDELCSPTADNSESEINDATPTDTTPTDATPTDATPTHENTVYDVCYALATIFKSRLLNTNTLTYEENAFLKITDDYGQPIDMYNGMHCHNTYTSIFFPNYSKIITTFADNDDAEDYTQFLQDVGNQIDSNVEINEFLRKLTNLSNILNDGSITKESYIQVIEDNLAAIKSK